MSLTNPLPRGARQMTPDYVSDGVNRVYSYNFWIANALDLAVLVQQTGAATFSPLVNGVDFTVGGAGVEGGGVVTLAVAQPVNTLVRVMGLRIPNRTTSVVNGGSLAAQALETELDVQTATMQELRRDVSAAEAITLADLLPFPAADLVSGYVGFNASGALIIGNPVTLNVTASTFMQSLLGSASPAAVLAALGAASPFMTALLGSTSGAQGLTALGVTTYAQTLLAAANQAAAWTALGLPPFLSDDYINVVAYGADPTGTNYCDSAFAAAWTAFMASTAYSTFWMPPGTYKFQSPLVWDCVGRAVVGGKIRGAGQQQTILNFQGIASGNPFTIKCSGGTSPTVNLAGYYRFEFSDFAVFHASSSPALIGLDNGSDSIQESIFENLQFINLGGASAGAALRINQTTQSTFINIIGNATPAVQSVSAGHGAGCEITMAAFCSFIDCSFANGNIGLHLTDNGLPGVMGFIDGNIFQGLDIENVQTCILNTSGNSSDNLVIGGRLNPTYSGGGIVSSTGGFGANVLTIDTPSVAIPSGVSAYYVDPSNYVGVTWRGALASLTSAPAVPASSSFGGSPTYHYVPNNTGQGQSVNIWGGQVATVGLLAYGASSPFLIGTLSGGQNMNFYLGPGDQICMAYAAGFAPSWSWTGMRG